MMIILGIFSILQMLFLPGLLVLRLIGIKGNYFAKLILVFGSSLFMNYLLVFLLTLVGAYSQIVLICLFILEVLFLFWLYRGKILNSIEAHFHQLEQWIPTINVFRMDGTNKSSFFRVTKLVVYLTLLVLAAIDIVWVFRRFTNNFGTVFNTWDAIVSWNRWAVQWASGILPTSTSYYPQLIPANWSLSYVFMNGLELQSFPKVIMPLFSLLMLLMLLDLGLRTRSFGFFIGVIFTRLVIKKFTGEFIADGYVDLPTAFFGFASAYLLLISTLDKRNENRSFLWVVGGLILAAAGALTKQAGIFVFLVYPLLVYLIVFRKNNLWSNFQQKRKLMLWFGLAFLVVLSWYLYKWIEINLGLETSNIYYVTQDIYRGAGYLDRFKNALVLLEKYGYLLIALLPVTFFIKKPYQWLGFIIAIPYAIIWILFFSYEARNLALIFPIWGMMIGLFIELVYEKIELLLEKIKFQKLPAATAFVLLAALLASLGMKLPLEKLVQNQEEKQWQIFNPELNSEIRDLIEESGTDIKILTNYPVDFLPGLKGHQVSYWFDNIEDYDALMRAPDFDYMLVPHSASSEVADKIQEGLDSGILQIVFESEGGYSYQMLKVMP